MPKKIKNKPKKDIKEIKKFWIDRANKKKE